MDMSGGHSNMFMHLNKRGDAGGRKFCVRPLVLDPQETVH